MQKIQRYICEGEFIECDGDLYLCSDIDPILAKLEAENLTLTALEAKHRNEVMQLLKKNEKLREALEEIKIEASECAGDSFIAIINIIEQALKEE
jgi:hypothetical protein